MCVDCGCGGTGRSHRHEEHSGNAESGHSSDHLLLHRHGSPRSGEEGRISLEIDILAKNGRLAGENRKFFRERGVLALNLLSSPGGGKTTLIEKTIGILGTRVPLAVIEGDQATSRDADRIRELGIPAVQINTGKGCHLDAHMVGHASDDLPLTPGSALLIENIGNLVCPALFDLGESARVVLFSVTEGEDKPLKYPQMFQQADLVLLSKIDLLPYLDFDCVRAIRYIRAMNPDVTLILLSSRSGEGVEEWTGWIESRLIPHAGTSPGMDT